MSTFENLYGDHTVNLASALARASSRHALLSNNLANVNTPGFKRKDNDFNIILNQEMSPAKARQQQFRETQEQAASDRTSIRMDGNNVDLEREVMSLVDTSTRYEALSDLTAAYFSNLKQAIREGR